MAEVNVLEAIEALEKKTYDEAKKKINKRMKDSHDRNTVINATKPAD